MTEKTTPPTETDTTSSTGTTSTTDTSTTDTGTTGHRRLPSMPSMSSMRSMKLNLKGIRTLIARIVWLICLVFALILAAAVLLIAIDANADNDLVDWIINRSFDVDLGFFDLTDPVKDFDTDVVNPAEDTRTALFNYGIAAIVWLAIGRIADRIIRP